MLWLRTGSQAGRLENHPQLWIARNLKHVSQRLITGKKSAVLRDFRGGDKRELPVLGGSFATLVWLQRFEQ